MTNTQSKPSKIPEFFIFRNDGSPEFNKCLEWLNHKFNESWSVGWEWYGCDGSDDFRGSDAWDSPDEFQNNPTRFEPAELWALIQEEQKGETVTNDPLPADVREIAKQCLYALIQAKHNHNTAPEIALDLALDLDRRLKEKGL